MRWNTSSPTLVTLEGENENSEYAELLGIDQEDLPLVGKCNRLSYKEMAYLDEKYPEYMGIWPLLAKIGTVVVKGVSGIAKSVKKRKAEKAASAQTAAQTNLMNQLQQQAAIQQQQAIQQQYIAAQKAEQTKKMLMIGVPIAAIGLIAFMSMSQKPAKKAV